jgi:electron transport complex protein RnfD
LLLVQPEQLSYDLAYALALLPLVVAAIIFFLQDAILLFAISFLAGIVCLLAIQLGRLSFGLPAWVGFKATHPLVASVLVACFFSPRTPAWVAALAVIVYVVVDTLIWPQLQRVMLHPALIVFGLLYIVQRQLDVGFINPFDGRHLDDPLLLWYRLQILIDPVKLYVGNVPGPIGVTSAGAVLLGVTYLWYTRKTSLGVVAGFLSGVAVVAIALRSDIGFQLASGPSLFLAGYIAADRRRVQLPEQFTFLFGAGAGVVTMLLRWYGEGLQSAWEGLLLASIIVTIVLRVQAIRRSRARGGGRQPQIRSFPIESGSREPRREWEPVRSEVRQPAMAVAPVASASYSRSAPARGRGGFEPYGDHNDMVRQMRDAANRGRPLTSAPSRTLLLLATLVIINPIGLLVTWTASWMNRQTKLLVTALSAFWYLGVAGLGFALLHR